MNSGTPNRPSGWNSFMNHPKENSDILGRSYNYCIWDCTVYEQKRLKYLAKHSLQSETTKAGLSGVDNHAMSKTSGTSFRDHLSCIEK